MLPFQRNFSFGAVDSAGENHLSADCNVVSIVKCLFTNFCETRNCVAVCVTVRVTANLPLRRSCAPGVLSHFVNVSSAWVTLSLLVYATTIHIVRRWDRTRGLRCTSEWPQALLYHGAVPLVGNKCLFSVTSTSLTGFNKSHEMHV